MSNSTISVLDRSIVAFVIRAWLHSDSSFWFGSSIISLQPRQLPDLHARSGHRVHPAGHQTFVSCKQPIDRIILLDIAAFELEKDQRPRELHVESDSNGAPANAGSLVTMSSCLVFAASNTSPRGASAARSTVSSDCALSPCRTSASATAVERFPCKSQRTRGMVSGERGDAKGAAESEQNRENLGGSGGLDRNSL